MTLLDLCRVLPGDASGDALRRTMRLAAFADQLGLTRFWLAEHHGRDVGQSAPEIVLPALAAYTARIRLGVGGLLLPYYSDYRLRQLCKLLSELIPGRLDIGMARGQVDPSIATQLLGPSGTTWSSEPHEVRINNLVTSARDEMRAGLQLWVMASSMHGVSLAAKYGLPVSLSLFLPTEVVNPEMFRSATTRSNVSSSIAVAGICAPTDAEALEMVRSHVNPYLVPTVVGSPGTCIRKIRALEKAYGVDEVVFIDLSPTEVGTMTSLSLLASARRTERALSQRAAAVPDGPIAPGT